MRAGVVTALGLALLGLWVTTGRAGENQGAPSPPIPVAIAGRAGLPFVAAAPGSDPSAVATGEARGAWRVEVVTRESALYRDAYSAARQVGHVTTGERLYYVDAIDRRLRILNALVFDGGHWIKVRALDGTEGWVRATSVREVR